MTNTNATNKVTIADKFNALIDYFNAEDKDNFEFEFNVTEFLEDRLEKSKKNSTKTEKPENADIRTAILEVLANGKARISDITKGVNSILESDYSSNKVSAQVTILKNEGTVIRTVDKKIAYFEVA